MIVVPVTRSLHLCFFRHFCCNLEISSSLIPLFDKEGKGDFMNHASQLFVKVGFCLKNPPSSPTLNGGEIIKPLSPGGRGQG
jgi:hypothetical protein